jgi:hypothetical protein
MKGKIMRMKEKLEDIQEPGPEQEAGQAVVSERMLAARRFADMCWKTDMYNWEIAQFLGIPERRLYRYLAGSNRVPKTVLKLLQLKLDGIVKD